MLLRDSIVTRIMDLVKCNDVAFLYRGKYYPLGVAPTEDQINMTLLSGCLLTIMYDWTVGFKHC